MSSIFSKTNYLDKSIPFLVNSSIIEYDMHDAGFSLIKENGLLDQNTINYIETLDKSNKNRFIGIKMREKPNLATDLMKAFELKRKEFAKLNGITDEQVLSIKKDAIFIVNKRCTKLKLGLVEFAEKNKYTSYYYLNEIEFYYNKNNGLDIKGLPKEVISSQEDFLLNDLKRIMHIFETGSRDQIVKVLRKYRHDYLSGNLPIETYREMNSTNMYRTKVQIITDLMVDSIDNINMINIGYNYQKYIIPLINYAI